MKQLTPHQVLPIGSPVRITTGCGYQGVVMKVYPSQCMNDAVVHVVQITRKHNGLSGKRSGWIVASGIRECNYSFLYTSLKTD